MPFVEPPTYVKPARYREWLPSPSPYFKVLVSDKAEEVRAKWKTLGKPLPRLESLRAVTGTLEFAWDYVPSDVLYGFLLHSPYPHAKIVDIDTSKAEALPGVAAVVTYKDVDAFGVAKPVPQYYLADKASFAGDIVAAVAAEDPGIAVQALDLIEVKYEPLPFALDPETAMTIPDIFPAYKGNLGSKFERTKGKPDEGFAASDVTITTTYKKPNVRHMYTEPIAAMAWWKGDELYVRIGMQTGAQNVAETLSTALGIPASKIHVRQCRMGGGFGGKFGATPVRLAVIAAMLSRKAGGRPVKLLINQFENFTTGHYLDPGVTIYKLKIGAKRDGTVTAMDIEVLAGSGRALAGAGMRYAGDQFWNNIKILNDNAHILALGYITNTLDTGALRAYGSQAGAQPINGALSELIEKLGMDPVEFYIKNGKVGDGKDWYTHYLTEDYVLCGGDVPRLVELTAKEFGWKEKWKGWGKPTAVIGSKRRGVGMAVASHASGWGCGAFKGITTGFGGAVVRAEPDGSVRVVIGLHEMGSGLETGAAQTAAEALGLTPEQFSARVRTSDAVSEGQPNIMCTCCSIATATSIYGAYEAGLSLKKKILEGAALWFGGKPEDFEIDWEKRIVYLKADPTKSLSFTRLRALTTQVTDSLLAYGTHPPYQEGPLAPIDPKTKLPLGMRGYFVCFVEVEVDTETGEVAIVNMVNAIQPGMLLNPMIMWGQLVGGTIHGVSQMLGEGAIYDETTGRHLNPSLIYYKMYLANDVREEIVKGLVDEHPHDAPLHPFFAKGTAEGMYAAVWGAIQEAIYNAIGVRIREFPFTPERILKALGKAPFPDKKTVA